MGSLSGSGRETAFSPTRVGQVERIEIDFVGGTITFDDGYVRRMTIDTVTRGRPGGSTVTYADYDRAMTILQPQRVELCSSFPLHTAEGEMCQALEIVRR
jgi:hypothetical protein